MPDKVVKIGDHFHVNGDSTSIETYQALLGQKKVKLILADPPYCLLTRRNKKTGAKRDPKKAKINHEAVTRFENVRSYKSFTKEWMSCSSQYLESDGYFIIWTNFLGKKPIKEVAESLGFHFIDEFHWGKFTKESTGNEANVRVYEVALIFHREKINIDNFKDPEMPYFPRSVITHYDEEGLAREFNNHPNHKPYSSLDPILRTYSKVGDSILDPFSGSGSTPAAAIELKRNVFAIELRKEWASVSQERMKSLIH